ncbi:DNA-3-methyladenine glycosylase 1, partial [Linum grandiflorum]
IISFSLFSKGTITTLLCRRRSSSSSSSIARLAASSPPSHMGEHTQSQPPDSQSQSQSQNQPQLDSATTPTFSSVDTVTVLPTDLTPVPPLQTIVSPLAKIPSRPRKIRKLSPEGATGATEAQATDSLSLTTAAETSKTAATPVSTATKLMKLKASSQQRAPVPRIIPRSLSCEGEVETAIRHLRQSDPILSSLIDLHPPPTFDTFQTPFLALTRSILYQQLAFKAGTSIYSRFISLCGGEAGVLPETVLTLTPQQLRQIGVSGRKASYLHDLARKYEKGILSDSAIVSMDDKSLFTMLTMVNGIGSWSVHMFMIFSLHRPDVLPSNDVGVRKGFQLLYNLDELPRPSQMDQLCEKWRPYRSVASWYLWRFVDAKGTASSGAAVATGVALEQNQEGQNQNQPQPQHQQPQTQTQLIDPISVYNLGPCAWGQ